MSTTAIQELCASLYPGSKVLEVAPFGPDSASGSAGATAKAAGYGRPLRVELALEGGRHVTLVFRTAGTDEFGHDRRSDRAQQILCAWDTFGTIPRHVRPVDVGAIVPGRLVSLRDAGELYLVTEYAPGKPYAEDLRRIAKSGRVDPLDVDRCDALARWLLALHGHHPPLDAVVWRRAVRDLVGHGEGIMGVIDAYPADVPGAPPSRLEAIEARCLRWRWRAKHQVARLRRTHGDFHPFNVLFQRGADFTVLDASRGCLGDAADDVTCMALNYVFFALERPEAWARGLAVLWRRFWRIYLGETSDGELLEAAAPFLAWRGLVMANPKFYPALPAAERDRLLRFVERALDAPRFDPAWAEDLFA
jgi:hypothetical protein